MKRALTALRPQAEAAWGALLRISRGRTARLVGFIIGCLLLIWGLWVTSSRIDVVRVASALGFAGLAMGVALGSAAGLLGALAWAFTASAILPGTGLGNAMRIFLVTLPMKYLPGSVWSHVGRAAWLDQTQKVPGPAPRLGSHAGPSIVAIDFGLLLWSGLVAVGASGLLAVPQSLSDSVSPALWIMCFGMLICVSVGIMAMLGRFVIGANMGSLRVFAVRISIAHGLQVLSWLVGAVLLQFLESSTTGYPQSSPAFSDSMLALYVGMVAGLAALVVPNGIGVREAVISVMLGGSAPVEAGFLASLLFRAVTVVSEIVIFLGAMVLARVRQARRANNPKG
jgi:hypothetical protein